MECLYFANEPDMGRVAKDMRRSSCGPPAEVGLPAWKLVRRPATPTALSSITQELKLVKSF
jgi:hypothetical protein